MSYKKLGLIYFVCGLWLFMDDRNSTYFGIELLIWFFFFGWGETGAHMNLIFCWSDSFSRISAKTHFQDFDTVAERVGLRYGLNPWLVEKRWLRDSQRKKLSQNPEILWNHFQQITNEIFGDWRPQGLNV